MKRPSTDKAGGLNFLFLIPHISYRISVGISIVGKIITWKILDNFNYKFMLFDINKNELDLSQQSTKSRELI